MTAPAILAGSGDLLIEDPNRSISAALYAAGLALEQAARRGLPAPLGVAVHGENVHIALRYDDALQWQWSLTRPRIVYSDPTYLQIVGDYDNRSWILEGRPYATAVAR